MVILESTTYPGTTEELLCPILEVGSGLKAGADFMVGYSPERIDPGNGKYRLENTPKVVSGMDAVNKIKKGSSAQNGAVTGPDKIVRMRMLADAK